jgi:hypothetical protein
MIKELSYCCKHMFWCNIFVKMICDFCYKTLIFLNCCNIFVVILYFLVCEIQIFVVTLSILVIDHHGAIFM